MSKEEQLALELTRLCVQSKNHIGFELYQIVEMYQNILSKISVEDLKHKDNMRSLASELERTKTKLEIAEMKIATIINLINATNANYVMVEDLQKIIGGTE